LVAVPPAPLATQYVPDKKERTFMGSVKDEDSEAMVIVPKSTAKVSKAAKQNKIVEMFQEDD